MDELELLKKDWKENKSDDFKNYTEKEKRVKILTYKK